MNYRFFICDVFTTERFGGNQLAVLPDATGLETDQMQQIAREFNYSETTFVQPTGDKLSRRVRIFTPTAEMPFAGHPNIGTAFSLALDGQFGQIGSGVSVTFEEAAGPVPITVKQDEKGLIWCELTAPQPLSLAEIVDAALIAEILSVELSDIETSTHQAQVASVGLPFVLVELKSLNALQRARINTTALEKLQAAGIVPDIYLYTHSEDEFDIRARMFAPFDGVPEDPATGSANCALVALLTQCGRADETGGCWRIAQGMEMGRPSLMEARTRVDNGVIKTWIGGNCVHVAEGYIEVA